MGGWAGVEMTRQTIIFLRGVLVDWKVALVLPTLRGLQEVNAKFHSEYERPAGERVRGSGATGWQRGRVVEM